MVKIEAENLKEKVKEAPRTGFGRFVEFLSHLISLNKESYVSKSAQWVFKALGLEALSLMTKIIGFFMFIVFPLLLILLTLIFPELMKINPEKFVAGKPIGRPGPERASEASFKEKEQ